MIESLIIAMIGGSFIVGYVGMWIFLDIREWLRNRRKL